MGTIRVRVALAAAVLLLAIVAPVPAYAATPTTTDMTLETVDLEYTQEVCIDVATTVTGTGESLIGGKVTIYDTSTGSDVFYQEIAYTHGSSTGWCDSDGYSIGTHSFRADYSGSATYDPSSDSIEFEIPKMTPQFFLTTVPVSPDAGSAYQINAGYITQGGFDGQDTIEVHAAGIDEPICSGAVLQWESITCNRTAPSAGTLELTVSNDGVPWVEGATSDPFEVVVQENTVHASGLAVQYSTFYPVKDGYRDTVAIIGTRDEELDVTIRIYSPGGTLLTTKTIGTGTGAYSYVWNGRKSDGSVRPSGKYKITQQLEDEAGASETSTFFVTLSKKKLTWHSDTITKKGSSISAFGEDGRGSVSKSGGTIRLKTPDGFGGDWSGVGYQFSLKSGLGYKDVTVAVYAKRGFVGGPVAEIGAQDFDDCPLSGTWDGGCFDHWKSMGNASNTAKWYTTRELADANVSGTKVRSMVSNGSGTTYVYKAKVTYKYATLE